MNMRQILTKYKAESTDVVLYSYQDYNDLLIRYLIKVEGQIEVTRMKKAIRLSLDSEPITGCRLIRNDNKLMWERHSDLESFELCSVTKVENEDKVEEVVQDFILKKVDPENELIVQTHIVRGEYDTICFKAHHTAMDAGGLYEYIYLLFEIYNQLKNDPSWKPSINYNGSRDFMQVSKHLSLIDKIKCLRRGFRDNKIKAEAPNLLNIPIMHDDLSDRALIIRTIDRELFQKITRYRREKGVSFNDFMIAIFTMVWFKMLDSKRKRPVQISFPCSFRNHYLPTKKAEAICNLSGIGRINIFSHPDDQFETILTQVRDKVALLKNDYMGLFFLPITKLPMPPISALIDDTKRSIKAKLKAFQETGNNNQPINLSNTGPVAVDKITPDNLKVLEAYSLPPIECTDITFSLSGFENTVTMGAGTCNASENRQKLEQIFDLIFHEIHEQLELPVETLPELPFPRD